MRYSAITIVACIFAVSVASLPIGERRPNYVPPFLWKCSLSLAGDVPPTKETNTCTLGVDGAVADSACYRKRDVPAVAVDSPVVPVEETETCAAGIDGAVADSACYKKREAEEEEMLKRQNQCEKNTVASVDDSACYKKREIEAEEKRKRQNKCEMTAAASVDDSACY